MKTHELITRYFKSNIIGSYLFVQKGLLQETEVNDIDINVDVKQLDQVRAFLIDNGYKETKAPYKQRGYADMDGSKVFIKENEKSIHILDTNGLGAVHSIGQLIAEKFNRATKNDLYQILKVVECARGTVLNKEEQ